MNFIRKLALMPTKGEGSSKKLYNEKAKSVIKIYLPIFYPTNLVNMVSIISVPDFQFS